jgi:hypothetical protein
MPALADLTRSMASIPAIAQPVEPVQKALPVTKPPELSQAIAATRAPDFGFTELPALSQAINQTVKPPKPPAIAPARQPIEWGYQRPPALDRIMGGPASIPVEQPQQPTLGPLSQIVNVVRGVLPSLNLPPLTQAIDLVQGIFRPTVPPAVEQAVKPVPAAGAKEIPDIPRSPLEGLDIGFADFALDIPSAPAPVVPPPAANPLADALANAKPATGITPAKVEPVIPNAIAEQPAAGSGGGNMGPITVHMNMNITIGSDASEEDIRRKFQDMLAEGADLLERKLEQIAADHRRRSYS